MNDTTIQARPWIFRAASPVASRLILCIALLAAGAFVAVASLRAQSNPSANPPHAVIMKQVRFQPAEINVEPGDTVEWKNEDIFAHTVTANDGSFDSGLIQPGRSWKMTVKNAGTIGYHCRPHPNMMAKLVVAEPTAQTQHPAPEAQGGHQTSLRWSFPSRPEELHPIFVNFTAALLPLAFLSDVLGRLFRRAELHAVGAWMTVYAAVITPLTAAAGWWWKRSVGPELPPNLILIHQWLGTSAVVLFIVLAVWRWRFYKRGVAPSAGYFALALLTVIALVYQGSLGGAMVFGQ